MDEHLCETIAAFEASLPGQFPESSWVDRLLASPGVAKLVVSLPVAALLVASVLAWDAIGPGGEEPLPLAHPVTPLVDGWLLLRGEEGSLDALNLVTGERRVLVTPPSRGGWPEYHLSPDGQFVAEVVSYQDGSSVVSVYRLDGQRVRRWIREGPEQTVLSGWLDAMTLLLVERPVAEPVGYWPDALEGARTILRERYERAMRDSRLLALDIASGQERTLAQGAVDAAYPSPDGRLVALVEPQHPERSGRTLVLRSVIPQGLGPPLATVEDRLWGDPVWARDSQRLYFTRILDPDVSRPIESQVFSSDWSPGQLEIAALDRGGALVRVMQGDPGQELLVTAVSPDGTTVVYWAEQDAPPAAGGVVPWATTWRVGRDGTGRVQLASAPAATGWSRDGTILVVETQPFFMPGSRDPERPAYLWTLVSAVGDDGAPSMVMAWPGILPVNMQVVSWLPTDALPAATGRVSAPIRGEASVPRPVPGLSPQFGLDHRSSASPDGQRVVLANRSESLVVWDVDRRSSRYLRPDITDVSWFPGAPPGLAGATQHADDDRGGLPLGLVFYPGETVTQATGADAYTYDPLGIARDPHRRYARPLVSPAGVAVAFFTVADATGTIDLWVTTSGGRIERVAVECRWPPGSLLGRARPLAVWLDGRTLLWAVPEAWDDGLPQLATLWRVTVDPNGEVAAERVLVIGTRGRETGLHLRELALSPDGTALAYRLRRYTGPSDAVDTLVVLPLSDVNQRLELARGALGDGIAWSPDGRWLVAGLGGRLALLAADGRERVWITPGDTDAAYPVWVGEHTVWYQQGSGDDARVMAVEIW